MSFAAALTACTMQIHLGCAVAQMSLHHPIRLAMPAFKTQQEYRQATRKKVYEEQERYPKRQAEPAACDQAQH